MTKKTYNEILNWAFRAQRWLTTNKAETKFRYAVRKTVERAGETEADYQRKMEAINIRHCATDDKGVILQNDKGEFQFRKPDLESRNKERDALFDSKVDFEPYMAAEIPKDLAEADREFFTGWVIEESPELSIVKKRK